MILKRLGKQPQGDRLKRIKKQENYKEGKFHNVEPTEVNPLDVSMFTILKKFLTRPSSVRPSREIPNKKTDLINIYSNTPAVIWFGHSSYLLHYKGYNILVDPVFSGHASPVKFYVNPLKEQIIIMLKTFLLLTFYYLPMTIMTIWIINSLGNLGQRLIKW